MNKKNLISVLVIILVIGLLLALYLKSNKSTSDELLNVCIEDDCFKLKEDLRANAWNGLEVYIDDEEYDEYPTIYGDITIGSDAEDVFKIFDIKPGYAHINMEVSGGGDGTTDIKKFEYKDLDFLEERYLDAYITFGYKKVNGRYVMVEASEIEEYYENEENDEIDVLFGIDINGMSDEEVNKGEVIIISINVLD